MFNIMCKCCYMPWQPAGYDFKFVCVKKTFYVYQPFNCVGHKGGQATPCPNLENDFNVFLVVCLYLACTHKRCCNIYYKYIQTLDGSMHVHFNTQMVLIGKNWSACLDIWFKCIPWLFYCFWALNCVIPKGGQATPSLDLEPDFNLFVPVCTHSGTKGNASNLFRH